MAPDFTSFTLDILHNEWGTGDAPAPKRPIIIDARNTERQGPREKGGSAKLSEGNVIRVGAAPDTTNQPDGFAYNYNYEGGADVRIRGQDADESGHIDGIDDWNALTGEALRIINSHRRHPIDQEGYAGAYTLRTDNISDLSQRFAETYWLQFDVLFSGKEVLA